MKSANRVVSTNLYDEASLSSKRAGGASHLDSNKLNPQKI